MGNLQQEPLKMLWVAELTLFLYQTVWYGSLKKLKIIITPFSLTNESFKGRFSILLQECVEMCNWHISVLGLQSTVTVRLEELDSQEEEDEEEVEEEDEDEEDEDEEGIIVEFCQEDILEEVLEHAVSKQFDSC